MIVFGLLLGILALIYFFTSISRTALFWGGIILTRPMGAALGDFLDKPLSAGGLELSRYTASIFLFLFMLGCIVIFPQRPARQKIAVETSY